MKFNNARRKEIQCFKKILIEAHRGNSKHAPENTLAAFSEAIEIGAHRVELDLRCSADGKLVILHDETVDRTTNGSGMISVMDYNYIKKLDAGSWKSSAYKGEKVPLLEEVYELCRGRTMLNIDLKDICAVPNLLKITRDMKMEDAVVITGKIPECANKIRKNSGYLPMFYDEGDGIFNQLLNSGQKTEAMRYAIRQACYYGLQGFLFSIDFVDEEIVHQAHLHGLSVNVWDVNTPEQVEYIQVCGADALMTDDPGVAKETLFQIIS